jgi:hypothetical protein
VNSNQPTTVGAILDGFLAGWLADDSERAPVLVMAPAGRTRLSPEIRRAVLLRDGYTCRWCFSRRGDAVDMEADHILPWSAGGADHPVNLRALCRGCNQRRSNRVSSLDRRVHPIVTSCRRCDRHAHLPGPEIDAYCLWCRELGPSPYRIDLLIGGATPATGLPPATFGLRDGSGIAVAPIPQLAPTVDALKVRLTAQTVACPWCRAGIGDPCVTAGDRPMVRAPAHPGRIAMARDLEGEAVSA